MGARALRVFLLFLPLLAAVVLTACGESRNPATDDRPASTPAQVPTAATLGAQPVATTAEYLAREPHASAKQTFAGVPDAGDRADLIAYLLAATAAED